MPLKLFSPLSRRSETCSRTDQCLATSFCLFALLMWQLVQQACRANSLTHISGDCWATSCRIVVYAEHTFRIHQLQFRARKCQWGHILENLVWTKKKKKTMEKTDTRVASIHVLPLYTCRLYTRRIIRMPYLYPRKYTGHVNIQYWITKIFTRFSTETCKK
jgi:hypothetical protein